MDLIEFREYCLSLEGVTEKMPFGKFAKRYDSILAFYVLGHMFCFIDIEDFSFVNIRSTPDSIDDIKMCHSSVSRPINQSLKYWIQINFEGDIPDNKIYRLTEKAYRIVKEKYTKRIGLKSHT